MMRATSFFCRAIVGSSFLMLWFASTNAVSSASDKVDFKRDVQPVLNEHCAACHGGVKKQSGFSVISRSLMLAETDSGQPAIIPGDSDQSELVWRIAHEEDPELRMPPGDEPLTQEQIAKLTAWIDAGAPWPDHWSYEALGEKLDAGNSTDGDADRSIDPIDRRILAGLDQQGLKPSPEADRRTLIRRLYIDLLGLLPTYDEVKRFENDSDPRAYQSLVDRLLQSPHFGERWARHWLDEARYADSEGYEKDSPKGDAYRFRDWVIEAINNDLPFDQFTTKQIAGDLIEGATDSDLIATKFHLQTQFNLEGGVDAEEDRTKRVIDRVNTIGTVWLAASIGCCQCHDHPYDPFTAKDYYAFYAFFNNADFAAELLVEPPQDADAARAERDKKWAELYDLLARQVEDKNLSNKVQASLSQLRKFDNTRGFTRFIRERTEDRRETYRFERGDFLRPLVVEGALQPATPAVLPPLPVSGDVPTRLDLANWLVGEASSITARVQVNKIWMHLFGQPLADQPNEFGSRGAAPTHPELLDWLARFFIDDARWSRKELIRTIVMSQTYRQSSVVSPELIERDPRNQWLSRQNRFRVEAEILRDLALQTSQLLSDKVGGPSVYPPLPDIIAQQTYAGNFKYKVSDGEDRYRRGLYTFFRRTAIDPNLATFDCPDSSVSRQQRDRSNNALQALALLQNEVFHEAAQAFAKRILGDQRSSTTDDQINSAYHIALGRDADPVETRILRQLINESKDYYAEHADEAKLLVGDYPAKESSVENNAAWIIASRVLLNLDEFVSRS